MSGETPEQWDCHIHRDELLVSDNCSVYHVEQGQLCSYLVRYSLLLFFPIIFSSKEAAYRWIESGCIAELQESLGTLQVAFSKDCMRSRP